MFETTRNLKVDLSALCEGDVSDVPALLEAHSTDYGQVRQRAPAIVLSPRSVQDIAAVVRYAAQRGLRVQPRGAGHSLGGQSLCEGAIVIDFRALAQLHCINEAHTDSPTFCADAGMTWQELQVRLTPRGLVPPVLTTYLGTTLGGTHSAGGLGTSSFRYGTQADNCLELEVVTGDGEVVVCGPERYEELFQHVLCGFSQFGLITKVKGRLRRFASHNRTYNLLYDDPAALIHDLEALSSNRFAELQHIEALISPCPQGVKWDGQRFRKFACFFYPLRLVLEGETPDEIPALSAFNNLHYYRFIHQQDCFTRDHFPVLPASLVSSSQHIHPWMDTIIPMTHAAEFLGTALDMLPLDFVIDSFWPMVLWPAQTSRTRMPLFRVPDCEYVVGWGFYPRVSRDELDTLLWHLRQVSQLSARIGCKRYLAGWIDYARGDWQRHFGDYWPSVIEMKRKYDPAGVFGRGFFFSQDARSVGGW